MTTPKKLTLLLKANADGERVTAVVQFERLTYNRADRGASSTLLKVAPEPWVKRHYRRAVMRGAGVYYWGLWAMLASKPNGKPAEKVTASLGGWNCWAEEEGYAGYHLISHWSPYPDMRYEG